MTELAAEGLIDPARVGIAGYSRGSQMVNVTVTNSNMFRAASSGDGGFLSLPAMQPGDRAMMRFMGCAARGKHRTLAPLCTVAECRQGLCGSAATSGFGIAVTDRTVRGLACGGRRNPDQLLSRSNGSVGRDACLLSDVNRLRAMRENIAWFDYWLLGQRDADAPFPDQMANWDRLKQNRQARCPAEP